MLTPHSSRVLVNVLAVVPGVGEERRNRFTRERVIERVAEVRHAGRRSAAQHDRENQMTLAIAKYAGFGEPTISHILPRFQAFSAATHEVPTGVTRFPTGAVERGQFALKTRDSRSAASRPHRSRTLAPGRSGTSVPLGAACSPYHPHTNIPRTESSYHHRSRMTLGLAQSIVLAFDRSISASIWPS